MDCEEQILVRGRTDHVGQDEENRRCHGSVPKVVGNRDLQRDYSEDDPFRERFIAHELGDLWSRSSEARITSNVCMTGTDFGIFLYNSHSPRAVGFFRH